MGMDSYFCGTDATPTCGKYKLYPTPVYSAENATPKTIKYCGNGNVIISKKTTSDLRTEQQVNVMEYVIQGTTLLHIRAKKVTGVPLLGDCRVFSCKCLEKKVRAVFSEVSDRVNIISTTEVLPGLQPI